jgi:serine/threonine-protein kinase
VPDRATAPAARHAAASEHTIEGLSHTQTIGKYMLERVLGTGSMGTVHAARDPQTGARYAVKALASELARDSELRQRFLREACSAGKLRHPNIVAVHDFGEVEGVPFFAMEYVPGKDLSQLIAEGGLSVEWKIDVLRQLCDGLAYAHENGLVHRDVKPANVRLTPGGHVKIMDFGIAHLASSSLTKRGVALGSVHYMAPEQLEGKAIDQRADVFSLGALAFELLSGKRPFDAESLTAVMAKVVQEPPDFSLLPSSRFSPGLENVVRRALEREVDRRYHKLEDMKRDLHEVVRTAAGAGVTAIT